MRLQCYHSRTFVGELNTQALTSTTTVVWTGKTNRGKKGGIGVREPFPVAKAAAAGTDP